MHMADADRDRILATLMEEWSPLQCDLLDRLQVGEVDSLDAACELRRQRSLARARLQQAVHARVLEDWIA